MRVWVAGFSFLGLVACGAPFADGAAGPSAAADSSDAGVSRAEHLDAGLADAGPVDAGRLDAGAVDAGPPEFQAAFHSALRWSEEVSELDTFGMRIFLGRGGDRVRVTLRAGDEPMQLKRVFIGHVDARGAVAGPMVQLPTSAQSTIPAHGYLSTGEATFAAQPGEEVLVTFEARGALAASAIVEYPGSKVVWGELADQPAALDGGGDHPVLLALTEVDVRGPPARAAIALGDSITEGYVSGDDDARDAWSTVAQRALGWPVVNAGVSGEGIWEEQQALADEVLRAAGITDCLVMLGTNDLGQLDAPEIERRLGKLWATLAPFCAVHALTLPPKERCDDCGELAQVQADRKAVNAWIRANGPGLIDAEAALRDGANPDAYAPGLGEDGIHPSRAGQRVLGQAVAAALAP